MRSTDEVEVVLKLVERGLNDCEISRRTRIPRGTVRDWRHGRIPGQARRAAAANGCPACGHPRHDPESLPPRDYAYLLGVYLGDGCISATRREVYHLRIELDSRYPGIIKECATAMEAVMPRNRVGVLWRRHQNSAEVGSWSRSWPCLFPQHGPGKKHDRKIELAEWQISIVESQPRAFLRGLIHSDGCRSINTIHHPKRTYRYPRYSFANRSADIRRIFCDACDRLDIEWRGMGPEQISVARASSVAVMDEFIGPKT